MRGHILHTGPPSAPGLSIAQLVRRRAMNPEVGGSSPAIGIMFHNASRGTYWTVVIMSKDLSGVILSRK